MEDRIIKRGFEAQDGRIDKHETRRHSDYIIGELSGRYSLTGVPDGGIGLYPPGPISEPPGYPDLMCTPEGIFSLDMRGYSLQGWRAGSIVDNLTAFALSVGESGADWRALKDDFKSAMRLPGVGDAERLEACRAFVQAHDLWRFVDAGTGAPSEGRVGIRDNADDDRWNREIVFKRGGTCFRIVRMSRVGAGGEMTSAVSHALDLKRLTDFQALHRLTFPPDRQAALLCAMGSV